MLVGYIYILIKLISLTSSLRRIDATNELLLKLMPFGNVYVLLVPAYDDFT